MRRLGAWWRRRPPRAAQPAQSPGTETWAEQIERRLNACEINLQTIWEYLNARS